MSKIFLTSDLHFGHDREFLYGPRGFSSIQEHDKTIIENWNKVVRPEDTVYLLGDVMLGDNVHGMECLSKLNGNINILRGNHDTDTRWSLYATLPNVTLLGYAWVLKYRKYIFYLSHYPTITSNFDLDKPLRAKTINLCGHSHTKIANVDVNKGVIYHCELDSHNNYPILLDDIICNLLDNITQIIEDFKGSTGIDPVPVISGMPDSKLAINTTTDAE